MAPRGGVNLVNLTLTLGLIAGVYAAIFVVPVYLDNLDVKEGISAAFGQVGHEPDDGRLKNVILARTRDTGTHWEDRDGARVEVPGLGLGPDDITVERRAEAHTARIRVDYVREIRLKPSSRSIRIDFHPEKDGPVPP